MIQQQRTFDGGLSTKIAPHLVAKNEAVTCVNVDLETGTLKPLYEDADNGSINGIYNYFFDGHYVSNTDTDDTRFYAEFNNRLYWSNGNFTNFGLMKYTDDNGADAVPPLKPDTALATATTANGNLDGTYTYTYTFVDTDDIEGIPSDFTEVTVSSEDVILTINPTNTPADTAYVRIYRTGGSNPTFNLIGEEDYTDVSGSIVYTDDTRDIDVSRIEINSFDNSPPPVALDMLLENRATFWGAVKNRVYFSKSGFPEFWGKLDFISLDDVCTGIGKIGNSVVAFTRANMYRIDGWNRDNISVEKLPYNQGCKDKYTVANIDNYLLWTSDNGICLYNGSTVEVLTKDRLSWDEFARVGESTYGDYTTELFNTGLGYEIDFAEGYRDKLYAVYRDGVIIIDLSNGLKISTISGQDIKSLVYNRRDNVLSFIKGTYPSYTRYTIGGERSNKVATWETGNFQDEGTSITKDYRKLFVDGDLGTYTKVTVYVDDKFIMSVQDRKEFFFTMKAIGKYIRFKIETNGEIKSIKYEYAVGSR